MNSQDLFLEDGVILEYCRLSTEQKLKWLNDALLFNEMVFTESEKTIREKIQDYF
ncbi:MAG TPA: hypothetical protein PKA14_25265 [Leptospiraceae bacterium]|nr:hypothetical protein [Leptospiraceae bacterium]